jgi:glycosyltransferase involved in cell wall biosynthesis
MSLLNYSTSTTNNMENLTAVIISFLRPGYTKACIASLRKEYPGIKIIVAENGNYTKEMQKFCADHDAKYLQMPYDSGVCVARNSLVDHVDTKYVLVGDDDFYYTQEAMVREMVEFLDAYDEFDLIGGRVSVGGIIGNYQGFIEKQPTHFQSTQIDVETTEFEIDERSGLRYCSADLTFNYFVARTDKVRSVRWDEEIKVAYEHYSWFYDFKCAGGKVAFTPDPVVIHKPVHVDPEQEAEYAAFRNRKSDRERFFAKYGIKYTISMNGRKTFAPNLKLEKKKNDVKQVDFCITTFKRPQALRRLMLSIAEYYPSANIYIADQNESLDRVFYKKLRMDMLNAGMLKRFSVELLPYDCGLSHARNHLVTTTPNQYKLILDDDMMFTPETDIGKFIKLLEKHPHAGVVGGLLKQNDVEVHFEFNPKKDGDTLLHVHDGDHWKNIEGIQYKKTGCVLNFALMRKDIFQHIQWDAGQKVSEHLDFYLRMAGLPYQVLYTPDVVIDHPPVERSGDYKMFRQRNEYMVRMLKKHKAKRVKYLNGHVVEIAEDGYSLKKYKEAK